VILDMQTKGREGKIALYCFLVENGRTARICLKTKNNKNYPSRYRSR
jgi:hypothetical protein